MAKEKTVKKVAVTSGRDTSAIDATIREIKTKFGDEAIMKLGEQPRVDIDAIPSGSIGLDWALGIGGYPRGRIIEIFGPESSGKTTLSCTPSPKRRRKAACARLSTQSMRSTLNTRARSA
jgi:hypothetical protein